MTFVFEVLVTLKPGLPDPQGKAVEGALPTLGWSNVRDVHVGKHIGLDRGGRRRGSGAGAGRRDGVAVALQPGDRALRGSWRPSRATEGREAVTSGIPRVGVITFPGSLDDRDALRAVETMGGEPVALWHADPDIRGVDAVSCPAGSATATTCGPARSHGSRRSWMASAGSPSAAVRCSGSATVSRSCARAGCCPAR